MTCNLKITYELEDWAIKITQAEKDCVWYIENFIDNKELTALDIGIGASYFYKQLNNRLKRIDGITVIDKEIEVANNSYTIFKVNKYDTSIMEKTINKYDLIIDVNPKMFACCIEHWQQYIKFILNSLTKDGLFITHTSGCGGFFGSPVEPLTIEELRSMSIGFNLMLTPSPVLQDHYIVTIQESK